MSTTKSWPQTSDKEFSKRMFIVFMWAFFVHIVMTIIAECCLGAGGRAVEIFEISVPVYTTIFAAVIVKGGVENVFKGKYQGVSYSSTTNSSNG